MGHRLVHLVFPSSSLIRKRKNSKRKWKRMNDFKKFKKQDVREIKIKTEIVTVIGIATGTVVVMIRIVIVTGIEEEVEVVIGHHVTQDESDQGHALEMTRKTLEKIQIQEKKVTLEKTPRIL